KRREKNAKVQEEAINRRPSDKYDNLRRVKTIRERTRQKLTCVKRIKKKRAIEERKESDNNKKQKTIFRRSDRFEREKKSEQSEKRLEKRTYNTQQEDMSSERYSIQGYSYSDHKDSHLVDSCVYTMNDSKAIYPDNYSMCLYRQKDSQDKISRLKPTTGQSSKDCLQNANILQMLRLSLTLRTQNSSPNTTPSASDSHYLHNKKNCQRHDLLFTSLSSFNKCSVCFGPVSSLRWIGYKCKGCSEVWHKSCFPQTQYSFERHGAEKHKHDSSSEMEEDTADSFSDIDYVPDSESPDEDDKDSDASKASPLKGPNPKFCQKVLSQASVDCSTTSPKQLTNFSEKVKEVEDLSKPAISSINFCFICGKGQKKISRHLKTHKTHVEVVQAFSLTDDKERKKMIEKLRNKGNFLHNQAVLQTGKGHLKVKRQTKVASLPGKFIHCMYCQGMFLRKELWRHVRRCPCKPDTESAEHKSGKTKVLSLAAGQESALCQQISSGVWKLLSVMNQDEVTAVVRSDFCILQFAQSLYNKHGHDQTKHEYIRQKVREVGRLLLCLRTNFSVVNLEDSVKPSNFQKVIEAVKRVSGFNEENLSYRTPSLALKLGHTLHKISDIIHCRALISDDQELIRSTETFKKLYAAKWSELVSHNALSTLREAKYNKPLTLPFTEDVKKLNKHLEQAAENATAKLTEEANARNYAQLAKVSLTQIIVFNRRRAGEVSKMRLKNFTERDNTQLHEVISYGLTELEQNLCNYFSRVELMGKRGRKVAILLPPNVVDALSLLVEKREKCEVSPSNPFLFARPKAMSHYRGHDCLRDFSKHCGAQYPEFLRSTQLRKHIATLSQVLNLKDNELDQVADFLGHDIRVHRDFYRLPVPTTQLAKISKLLLSLEKGSISSLKGKSLDDIEIEDELEMSDIEDGKGEDDSDEHDDVPCSSTCEVESVAVESRNQQASESEICGK
ncbi:hypothetical protein WMY93_031899, partial [Mugilogobius chulae]